MAGAGRLEALSPRSFYDTSVPDSDPMVALVEVGLEGVGRCHRQVSARIPGPSTRDYCHSFFVERRTFAAPPEKALEIQVTGHQWWWQVRYPDAQVTTANEIHIPIGQPVEIRATSTDVLHSLWIPQLSGKLDLMPDRQASMVIQASQPGIFRGECAEFCGVQHAHMNLIVVADSAEQFTQWLGGQQTVPPAPTDPNLRKGQQAFLGSACVYCHAIRGTNASGTLGPDLTHLASRQTIGAGMLPNSRGNLAGWIVDAQGIKPGNRMPPMQLEGDQPQAILDYLESLK